MIRNLPKFSWVPNGMDGKLKRELLMNGFDEEEKKKILEKEESSRERPTET